MPRIHAESSPWGTRAPLLLVSLRFKGRETKALAIVDSGADATLVPAAHVSALGLDFSQLAPMADAEGVGGSFSCARATQIQLLWRDRAFSDPAGVRVAASDLPIVLLGREDFFRHFSVRFNWHEDPPSFDVDPVAPQR